MKNLNVILDKTKYKTGSGVQLPVIIRLFQYNHSLINNSNDSISELSKARDNTNGNLSEGYMDFVMDFTHAPIQTYTGRISDYGNDSKLMASVKEKDQFWYINQILNNKKNPTFTREYFLKNYYVIEIPDYSHQSMSYGYRDFVPHVYYDGRKIWQKYVGTIRQYSKKVMWIVIKASEYASENGVLTIPSSLGNITIAEPSRTFNSEKFLIRMVAKNNIEKDISHLQRNADSGSGDYPVIRPIDAFDYYKKNNNNYEYISNLGPFFDLGNTRPTEGLSTQNFFEEGTEKIKKEYFRQAFINDYAAADDDTNTMDPGPYDRPSTKVTFNEDPAELDLIKISKQNIYNAEYFTGNNVKNQLKKDVYRYATIYDSNGFMVNPESGYEFTGTYELIPDYTSTRKFEWKSITWKDTAPSVNQILYDNYIYPYNGSNYETLSFTIFSGNKYLFNGNTLTKGNYFIIYDNYTGYTSETISGTETTYAQKEYMYIDETINRSNPLSYYSNPVKDFVLGKYSNDTLSKIKDCLYFVDETTDGLRVYDSGELRVKRSGGEIFINDSDSRWTSYSNISEQYNKLNHFLVDTEMSYLDFNGDDPRSLLEDTEINIAALYYDLELTAGKKYILNTNFESDSILKLPGEINIVYFLDGNNQVKFIDIVGKYLFCENINFNGATKIVSKIIESTNS